MATSQGLDSGSSGRTDDRGGSGAAASAPYWAFDIAATTNDVDDVIASTPAPGAASASTAFNKANARCVYGWTLLVMIVLCAAAGVIVPVVL